MRLSISDYKKPMSLNYENHGFMFGLVFTRAKKVLQRNTKIRIIKKPLIHIYSVAKWPGGYLETFKSDKQH